MFCPECNHKLRAVTIAGKSGSLILDYCSRCGGIWTDHAETNFFESKDLKRVEKLLPKKRPLNLKGPMACPHDKTKLEDLEHESVPYGVTVRHCPKCSGNWFPNNQLQKFKKAQKVKVNYFKVWNIPLHSIYAVLLPVLVVAILTAGLIGGIIGMRSRQDQQILADDAISTPSVVTISETEVMIVFMTQKEALSSITYWVVGEEKTTLPVSNNPQNTHNIRLKDLKPATTYSYYVTITINEKQTQSPVYQLEVE